MSGSLSVQPTVQRMPRWVFVPLALFLGMVAFLAMGLQRNPQEIPSPLIGQPAPAFRLPVVGGSGLSLIHI